MCMYGWLIEIHPTILNSLKLGFIAAEHSHVDAKTTESYVCVKSPGDGIQISQVWIQTDIQCRYDTTVFE